MFNFSEKINIPEFNTVEPLDKKISDFETETSLDDAKSFWDQMFFEPKNISILDILNHHEDDFDFDIDITDMTKLLDKFDDSNWSELSYDDKVELVNQLVEKIAEKLGLELIPEVVYYEDDSSNRGVFYAAFNALGLNECLLDDPKQLIKTTAHELRHVFQYQRAESPQNYEDLLYRVNLENYISPIFNEDGECLLYTDYASQFVEAEARAFSNLFNREGAIRI